MQDRPKIIVLDDDPTGSQTVHGCLLLTAWDVDTLKSALDDDAPLFFVLTNTRAMTAEGAASTTREVCRNLREALVGRGTPWLVVSRSDSTLRGHYPVETDVINEELGPFDAHFLVPAFFEGGRITRNGTHYVVTEGKAIPAHETVFARDAVFGYSTAYLPEYVEEKTGGRIRAADVRIIHRDVEPDELERVLSQLYGNRCVAFDAEEQADLNRVAHAATTAAADGKRFLFRSAASLLTSLAALPPQPVPPQEMSRFVPGGRPGLILVGSHVQLSTRQLARLLQEEGLEHVEIDVHRLPQHAAEIELDAARKLRTAHEHGHTVVISTSRTERRFSSAEERLEFGAALSSVLMRIVRQAPHSLGFIISKGGITSNDLLSTGLGLRTARVVGQIHPGCSVVVTPGEHWLPRVPVVIFPGNVGHEDSLLQVLRRITAAA